MCAATRRRPPPADLHGFWFFVPALVLGDVPQIALASAAFVTGPLVSELIVWGDARARRYEWPAIWCMLSLGQVRPWTEGCGRQRLFAPHANRPLLLEARCPATRSSAHQRRRPLHALRPLTPPNQVLILFAVELIGTKVLLGAPALPPCSKDESMFLTLLPSREQAEADNAAGQNGSAAAGATPRRSERLKHRSE